MTEEWREIPGYSGYEVSDQGRIRSWWKPSGQSRAWREEPKVLSPGYSGKYFHTKIRSDDGASRTIDIHVKIALVFLGPKPSDSHQVRHLDGNPKNNAVSNLAWGTPKENAEDRARHGRTVRMMCENNPRFKHGKRCRHV